MNNRLAKSLRRFSAQGMVEFALALPFLLVLALGIIEAGRMLLIYSATLTSSREAARYGSAAGDVGGYVAHFQDCAGIRAAARRVGSLAGIQDGNVTITFDRGPGTNVIANCNPNFTITDPNVEQVSLGDRIIVQVVAAYQPLIPLVRFSSFPITTTTRRTIIKDVEILGTPPSPVPPLAYFSEASHSWDETSGTVIVRVQISAPTSKVVSVPFSIADIGTEAGDYTLLTSSPLVISPGFVTGEIHIELNDDAMDEDDEALLVIMGTPTNAVKDSPDEHLLTILDNDPPPFVFFSASSQAQSEEADIAVNVQLSAPSSRDITVHFAVSGTALQGVGNDYTIASSPIVIPAGDSIYSIIADVNDDPIDEDDETIVVTMGAVENAIKGSPEVHTATILDNDLPPLVYFVWESQVGDESVGTMTAMLELSAPSSKEITVPFSVGGTAEQGSDYTISGSPVVIAPGETSAEILITVLDDGDPTEDDETVEVSIDVPVNATKGTPGTHTAIISNLAVTPSVSFTRASQSASEAEAGEEITIVAQLSAASSRDVVVPFSVGGSATQGSDFTIASGPLVIPAGGARAEITLTVLDDSLDEYNETVFVLMGEPSNATRGEPNSHTVTITDDDDLPTVYFSSTGQTQPESVGVMTASVSLSAPSGKPVTVPFTLGGTATPEVDFTISASPLTIPAGSLGGEILIAVSDDSLIETSEEIVLTLGAPLEANLGSPEVHTAVIVDNEPVCPTPASMPFFAGPPDKNKLVWTLSSPNPLISVNLLSVSIRWPSGARTDLEAITFGETLYLGSAPPPYLEVNTPVPLWSGAFDSRQLIFRFASNPKSVAGDFYQVTATFENCPPAVGVLPSD